MTAADGRAHTTDGEVRSAIARALALRGFRPSAELAELVMPIVAAERRRAAEDRQRLWERVEALAAELQQEGNSLLVLRSFEATIGGQVRIEAADRLRAALRDDA